MNPSCCDGEAKGCTLPAEHPQLQLTVLTMEGVPLTGALPGEVQRLNKEMTGMTEKLERMQAGTRWPWPKLVEVLPNISFSRGRGLCRPSAAHVASEHVRRMRR